MKAFGAVASGLPAPHGWSITPLWAAVTHLTRGATPKYVDEETGFIAFNQKCVRPDKTIDLSLGKSQEPPSRLEFVRAALRTGDLVINSTGSGTLGRVGLVNVDGSETTFIADGHVTILRTDRRLVNPRYLWYVLSTDAFYGYANDVLAVGSTNQTELAPDRLGNVRLLLPPLAAQASAVAFLDQECARIDGLSAEQRRQQKLLGDHDREFVREVVTGGDVDGQRKAAGPYWLGSVPTTWQSRKIAQDFQTGSGTTPASGVARYYGGPHPWLVTGECRDQTVYATAKTVTDEALRDYTALSYHPAGSVVIAMYGATIGRLATLGVPMAVNQACCVLSAPRGGLTLDFVYWWFWAHRRHVLAQGTGGGQGNISQSYIRGLRVPAPDVADQTSRVAIIAEALRKSGQLHREIDGQLDLLLEHKQALIAAVVTGEKEAA